MYVSTHTHLSFSLRMSRLTLETADWHIFSLSQWAFSPWIIQTLVNNSASLFPLMGAGVWTGRSGVRWAKNAAHRSPNKQHEGEDVHRWTWINNTGPCKNHYSPGGGCDAVCKQDVWILPWDLHIIHAIAERWGHSSVSVCAFKRDLRR